MFGSSRSQPGERTAAERERAREERARRRAAGKGLDSAPSSAHAALADEAGAHPVAQPDPVLTEDHAVSQTPGAHGFPVELPEQPSAEQEHSPEQEPPAEQASRAEQAPRAEQEHPAEQEPPAEQESRAEQEFPRAGSAAVSAAGQEWELEAFPPSAHEAPQAPSAEATVEEEPHPEQAPGPEHDEPSPGREPELDADLLTHPSEAFAEHHRHGAQDEGTFEDPPPEQTPAEIPLGVKLPPRAKSPERIRPLPPAPGGSGRKGRRSARRRERVQREGRGSRPAGGGKSTRSGRSTGARVGASLALVAALAVVWFLVSLFQPFTGSGGARVIVSIPKGSSSGQIGSILAHDGVVSSGFFFEARALIEGKRGDLRSGRFQMRHGMSYSAAIDTLSKPPPRVIAVSVTIPEGETRRQIAEIAQAKTITGSYLQASESSSLLDPTHYGAPSHTHDLEGFLFPATYDLHAGASATQLVAQQLLAFRRRFGSVEIRRARTLGVTPYQLLTVASMVEREAQVARDRPLVAAVIYNRLRLGMTLGIDATIRYALNDYSAPLTETQLHINSPYNTRIHHGLPPTPISNPGMASIDAAAHPAHVSYLYYVAAADGCGEQVFSTEYAEFERNAAAYQQALAKNHGRVPTCRKK